MFIMSLNHFLQAIFLWSYHFVKTWSKTTAQGTVGSTQKGEPSSLESLGELFARSCRAHPSKTFISPCGSCHLIPRFGFEWGSLRMPDVGNKGLKIIFPNNLPIYHSRRACALCEHVSREPDLTLSKEVQQQLLASACGLLFFFFFPFPFPEAAQRKAAPTGDQSSLSLPPCLPPSLPRLWIVWIPKAGLLISSLLGKVDSRVLSEMDFCKKIFTAALCVLVLLPDSGCARNLWKRALHLKMTEKYDVSKPRWGDLGGSWVCSPWNERGVFFTCVYHFRIRSIWIHRLSLYKRLALSFSGCTKLLPPSCCNGKHGKHTWSSEKTLVQQRHCFS